MYLFIKKKQKNTTITTKIAGNLLVKQLVVP